MKRKPLAALFVVTAACSSVVALTDSASVGFFFGSGGFHLPGYFVILVEYRMPYIASSFCVKYLPSEESMMLTYCVCPL